METVKKHRAAIMIMNVIVALLCIASIAGYFFAPLLSIRVTIDLDAEDLETIMSENGAASTETTIVYSDPDAVDIELSFSTTDFLTSVLGADPANGSRAFIDEKIDSLSVHLSQKMRALIKDVAEGTIRNTATQIVIDKAQETIKNALPEIADEEINAIMEEAQITDEYLAEKTNAVIDVIYQEDASVEKVSEVAVETVGEVFEKLQSTGKPEFSDLTMTDETAQQIRNVVSENIGSFASEDGKLNADEIIDRLLEEIAGGLGSGSGTASVTPAAPLSAVGLAADSGADASSGSSQAEATLAANISEMLHSYLDGENVSRIFLFVMIGVLVLVAISMLAWLYLLIKVFVKGFSINPAVKLKMPIIFLGWLPALFFFIIPGLASVALFNFLGGPAALGLEQLSMLTALTVNTSGVIALIAAALLIILFIPYGIIRKKLAVELAPRIPLQEEEAYIAANPSLIPQEPVYKEHTVNGSTYAAPEGTPAPVENEHSDDFGDEEDTFGNKEDDL